MKPESQNSHKAKLRSKFISPAEACVLSNCGVFSLRSLFTESDDWYNARLVSKAQVKSSVESNVVRVQALKGSRVNHFLNRLLIHLWNPNHHLPFGDVLQVKWTEVWKPSAWSQCCSFLYFSPVHWQGLCSRSDDSSHPVFCRHGLCVRTVCPLVLCPAPSPQDYNLQKSSHWAVLLTHSYLRNYLLSIPDLHG